MLSRSRRTPGTHWLPKLRRLSSKRPVGSSFAPLAAAALQGDAVGQHEYRGDGDEHADLVRVDIKRQDLRIAHEVGDEVWDDHLNVPGKHQDGDAQAPSDGERERPSIGGKLLRRAPPG